MSAKTLKIDSVLLDLENPRIVKASNQREALEKIIKDQGVKLAVLAEHVVANGLNPMDRLLVIRSREAQAKFTVTEGNRRLAVLKILNNPAVLNGLNVRPGLQRRLEAASANYDGSIQSISCFELKSREDGDMWITQRHTGENDGRGIVDWNGVARARFRGNGPALQALDMVLAHGDLTDDEKLIVDAKFRISTLDRLLKTPAVRATLGLRIHQGKLESSLPAAEVIRPLKRIVLDISKGKVVVTALKSALEQANWVSGLGIDLPDQSKDTGQVKPIELLEESDFIPLAPAPAVKLRSKAKTAVQRNLIPKTCNLNISNPKIQEVAGELRKLLLSEHPHAISVLFRVFLEQSVDAYLDRIGTPLVTKTSNGDKLKSLRTKVGEAIAALVAGGVPKKNLDGISKGIDDKNSPLHVDTLNAYVHSAFYTPQERELIVSWNNSQLFFEEIWS